MKKMCKYGLEYEKKLATMGSNMKKMSNYGLEYKKCATIDSNMKNFATMGSNMKKNVQLWPWARI